MSDSGGLYLEVTATGSERWFWKYRFDGKEKRLALGAYPEVLWPHKVALGCAHLFLGQRLIVRAWPALP